MTIVGYEYRMDGGSPIDVGLPDPLTFTVEGLAASTIYGFEVRGYDSEGNRTPWSNLAHASTLGALVWQPYRGTTQADEAAESMEVPFPSSIAAGDLLLLLVFQKPATSGGGSVDTPSGWTVLDSVLGTTEGSTSGTDNGDTNIFAFYKEAAGTELGDLTVAIDGGNCQTAVIHRFSKASGTWSLASVTGEQGSTGNVSITFGSDPGVESGDFILVAKASPTDINGGLDYTACSFIQGGITFGTVTQLTNNNHASTLAGGMGTNLNNDIGGCIHGAPVTAGTSAGDPQVTITVLGANHGQGPAMWVRIRAT